jgi:hypothetical protein
VVQSHSSDIAMSELNFFLYIDELCNVFATLQDKKFDIFCKLHFDCFVTEHKLTQRSFFFINESKNLG